MSKKGKIPIVELFGPTIQGEGLLTGTFSHFLRTGGCPLKCDWCDSLIAVDPKLIKDRATYMTTSEIMSELDGLPYAPYVTFTGGDPCIHEGLGEMIVSLNYSWVKVAVETQGTHLEQCEWLPSSDVITISPKGPSSGNEMDQEPVIKWILEHYTPGKNPFRLCVKMVIFTQEDLEYAFKLYRHLTPNSAAPRYDAFYFTAGTRSFFRTNTPQAVTMRMLDVLDGYHSLATMMLDCLSKGMDVEINEKTYVGCQQHVLLWPNQVEGV